LAIKVNDVTQSLIEAKAIYQDLKEGFVKQAVDYASNDKDGIDWVVLTNGVIWRVYKVIYSKPVDHELVVEIKFLELDHRNSDHVEMLFLYTKESWSKSALSDFYEKKQALSRFTIGAVLLTEPILTVLKRELKRISPDIKIDADQIRSVLEQEVLKREVVECDKADDARKRIARAASKSLRSKSEKSSVNEGVLDSAQKPPVEISPPSITVNPLSPPAA
jgi:hypothetical protein